MTTWRCSTQMCGSCSWPEPHRRAERDRAQRPLVAELDQLAHDLVEVGDLAQRGGRGAVRGVLVGPRGDALELVGADRERHPSGPYRPAGSLAPDGGSGDRRPRAARRPARARRVLLARPHRPLRRGHQGDGRGPRPAPGGDRGHDRVRPAPEARLLRRPRAVRLLHGAQADTTRARSCSSPSRSTSTSRAASWSPSAARSARELDALHEELDATDPKAEDYIVYRVFDVLTDAFYPIIELLEEHIDALEGAGAARPAAAGAPRRDLPPQAAHPGALAPRRAPARPLPRRLGGRSSTCRGSRAARRSTCATSATTSRRSRASCTASRRTSRR